MIPLTIASVCISTIWDLRTSKIPNVITIPSIIIGLIANVYLWGTEGLEKSIFGVLVGLLLFLLPFSLGGMGAGDVKLLAVVGAINGPTFALHTFLYSSIAGGLIAVGYVMIRKKSTLAFVTTTSMLRNIPAFIGSKQDPVAFSSGIKFPYGIAILVGTIAAYTLR